MFFAVVPHPLTPRGGEGRRNFGRKNQEETLDIQKRKGLGDLKSETLIEMKVVTIETIERTDDNVHRAQKTGQNWIGMR
jgi:hypothetical protein